ncbi:MAG: site-specific integrase, partial [Clostridia bacterium]|nr:site-specific integrase [Clostridia bacterium]
RKIRNYDATINHGERFELVASEWKEEHFQTLKPNSRKPYNGAYNRAMRYLTGKRINDITQNHIAKIIDEMKRQGMAKKTVAMQLLVLNQIFKYAIQNNLAEKNPCDLIETPKNLKKTKREMPSAEDIQKVIENVNKDPFGLFAYFLYFTGCRFGEALAIRGEDIDYEKNVIYISKSIYFENGPQIGTPKTESGTRTVPLLDCLKDQLPKLNAEEYLFSYLADRSAPYTQKRIFTQWRRYRERLEISCTPHQLRHGYATLLYEAGLAAKDAQQILGHATLEMTMDTYTHITKARAKRNTDKLNEYLNAQKKD